MSRQGKPFLWCPHVQQLLVRDYIDSASRWSLEKTGPCSSIVKSGSAIILNYEHSTIEPSTVRTAIIHGDGGQFSTLIRSKGHVGW